MSAVESTYHPDVDLWSASVPVPLGGRMSWGIGAAGSREAAVALASIRAEQAQEGTDAIERWAQEVRRTLADARELEVGGRAGSGRSPAETIRGMGALAALLVEHHADPAAAQLLAEARELTYRLNRLCVEDRTARALG